MQLTADFWIGEASRPDDVLLTPEEIDAFNRGAMAVDPYLLNLGDYPAQLDGHEVERIIRTISTPPEEPFHYRNGSQVNTGDFERYAAMLNLPALPDSVEVRFALVLERADMRAWPTMDQAFRSNGNPGLDRFQENGLFPADPVAVLHESADGLWCFARSYNYAAWVLKERLVFGTREEVMGYRLRPEFVIVVGSQAEVEPGPGASKPDSIQLDMGVRLPLMQQQSGQPADHPQRLETHHAVRLPARDGNGGLAFAAAYIERNENVHRGYLPYTRANVLRQAFKFLGEHYGWGHSRNARDCTGLVSEVYKTMGIYLPRNSWQQGQSPVGHNIRFNARTPEDQKIEAVLAADIGDLLYSTGHVMIYLGSLDGEPYVIHDTAGAGRVDENGVYHEDEYTGVSVTPLVALHNSPDTSYLDEMYAIKQIR